MEYILILNEYMIWQWYDNTYRQVFSKKYCGLLSEQ